MGILRALFALVAVVLSIACGPVVDLTRGLQVESVSTGWYEAVATNTQIKLVPAVSFQLKNLSDQKLGTLQVNAVFKRIDEDHEWASGFVMAVGSDCLSPGAEDQTLSFPSPLGAGVALLVGEKLSASARRAVGLTLVGIGAVTTIPAAMVLFGNRRRFASSPVSQDDKLIGARRLPRKGDEE